MRPKTSPVTALPSAWRAIGTCSQWRPPTSMFGRIAVPVPALVDALSPCQALARPMSPKLRSATPMVMGPPRLGTSCHISVLACAMSTGLVSTKVAT